MNPYESPATENANHATLPPVWRRWVAALLWLIGVQPAALVAFALVQRGPPPGVTLSDPWMCIAFGGFVLVIAVLPMIGFGLLGLAWWQRSWRLTRAGVVCVLVNAAVVGVMAYFA